MSPVLVGRDLHKTFGATPALRGASIAVDEGEIVAVMGPSGCGKSTLLHCLAGILRPDAGEVHIAGERIDHLPDARRVLLRRTAFGLIFQFGQLVPELSTVENVALPLMLAGLPRRDCRDEARGWLARVGISDLADRRPDQLSGGQGQRVALARAMVSGPRVVLADEPTGSLDSVGADQVMELLVAAAREQSIAVLVVTHEPRVAGFADRTVMMRDGIDTRQVTADPQRAAVGAVAPSAGAGEASLRVGVGEAEASADQIWHRDRR